MTPEMQNRIDRASRLRFLCELTSLDYLTSSESNQKLEMAWKESEKNVRSDLLLGYRLAVATPLHGLLDFFVHHGELLDLEIDEELAKWFVFGQHESGAPLLAALSDHESNLGRLCRLINHRSIALRQAGTRLPQTLEALSECRRLVTLLRETVKNSSLVSLESGDLLVEQHDLLTAILAERVLDYVEYDPSAVAMAYRFVWGSEEEFTPLNDEAVLEAKTQFGYISTLPFGKGLPKGWGKGILFAFDCILRESGITLQCHRPADPQFPVPAGWYQDLLNLVNPDHPAGEWPSMVFGLSDLKPLDQVGWNSLNAILGAETDPHIRPKDRLHAVLGPDTVQLLAGGSGTDYVLLKALLSGAKEICPTSKLRILRVVHSSEEDEREWVSLAVQVPVYGWISNYSTWYLFFRLYHEGPAFDNDVVRARSEVEDLLRIFEDSISTEEISGIDEDDLLPYGTLPAFQAMRDLSKKAEEINTKLRSNYAEVLAAFWLLQLGYRSVKVSFKRAALGKEEYDAVGVKDGACLAIEVKAGDVRDDQLQREIARFASKVDGLRAKLPELTRELGGNDEINGVSGLFVTLADLEKFEPMVQDVEVWGYDEFTNALSKIGLRREYTRLLEKASIIRVIRLDGFPDDDYLVGL